jgi:hypothetical protein
MDFGGDKSVVSMAKFDPDRKERYIIHISEWASIDVPKLRQAIKIQSTTPAWRV